MPVFSVRKHRKLHYKRLPICIHAIEYNIILRVLLISSGIHDADELCLVIGRGIERRTVVHTDFRELAG